MSYLTDALWRSALAFLVLWLIARIEGNKQLSHLSYFNYITGITIGSIAAMLSAGSIPAASGLGALGIWAGLALFFGWLSLKNIGARALTDGEPVVVIRDGEILERNMAKVRYNMNNLLSQLRSQQVFCPAEVAVAVLETDGKLSILKKPGYQSATRQDVGAATGAAPELPTELVIDGLILDENLAAAGKSEHWLRTQLGLQGIRDVRRVTLALLDQNGELFVQQREGRPRRKH